MNPRVASSVIIALSLILAAILHGGVYQITSAGSERPFVWRVNKFTGSMIGCLGWNCEPLRVPSEWWKQPPQNP